MPIILTVGFCRGFPFFSVERIINEEKKKPEKPENWTFYRDSKMSLNCKFTDFL